MEAALETMVGMLTGCLGQLPIPDTDRSLITELVLHRLRNTAPKKRPEPDCLNKLARDVARVIQQRRAVLDPAFEADPEWSMLLDLLIAHTEAREVSVSSLGIASGVPGTTALRYMQRMQAAGLITRKPSRTDGRRTLVEATPRALASTEELLRRLYAAG